MPSRRHSRTTGRVCAAARSLGQRVTVGVLTRTSTLSISACAPGSTAAPRRAERWPQPPVAVCVCSARGARGAEW